MKLNKIKTTLSLAALERLKKEFKFFTIEKSSSTKKPNTIAVSKTLTKVLAKNLELSKHLDSQLLKYPLVINFFENFDDLLKYLKANLKENNSNIVFVNSNKVALRETDSRKLSSLSPVSLFNNFNLLFSPAILVLKCIQISAANNTTKS
jgi:ribosomal protein L16 Arg81 hydroxylase